MAIYGGAWGLHSAASAARVLLDNVGEEPGRLWRKAVRLCALRLVAECEADSRRGPEVRAALRRFRVVALLGEIAKPLAHQRVRSF